MVDRLNKIVEKFVRETKIKDENSFNFIKNLIDIFERHYNESYIANYKKKISFNKNYRYSYQFLKAINPSYAEYLKKCKKDGTIELLQMNKNDELAYCDCVDGEPKIYLSLSDTLEDSYNLSHELIHATTLGEDTSITRHIFCEAFSYAIEELQRDYFEANTKIKEYTINRENTLFDIKKICERLTIEQKLILKYLENGKIYINDILDIYNETKNKRIVSNVFEKIIKRDDISIDIQQRYVIGYIFGCYMVDRIYQNENFNEFFTLNENINNYSEAELIYSLDLSLTDEENFNLTSESYKKLEKSYQKRIQKR